MPAINITPDDSFEDWRNKTNLLAQSIENVTSANSSMVVENSTVKFRTTNVDRLIIDATGEIGQSISPSAWSSVSYAYQQPSGSLYSINGTKEGLAQNAYYSGTGWKYANFGAASLYEETAGSHNFLIAPTGSADGAVAWANALYIAPNSYVGIGTISPDAKLSVSGSAANFKNPTGVFDFNVIGTTTSTYRLISSGAGFGDWKIQTGNTLSGLNGALSFYNTVTSTESGRIDVNGNFGLGTTSPTQKFHIQGSGSVGALVQSSGATGQIGWNMKNDVASTATFSLYNSNQAAFGSIGSGEAFLYTSAPNLNISTDTSSGAIKFLTGSANLERARIDSIGNVGIGVTPSVWGSNFKALQIGSVGSIAYDNNFGQMYIGSNYYMSGAGIGLPKYLSANAATRYDVTQQGFSWKTAVAGEANGDITWVQSLSLDINGNLLITGSGGIGYGAGSGGTVTQLTSRTSPITLNKSSGNISLFNATAPAGQVSVFQFNNSKISDTDVVIINVKSSTSVYLVNVVGVTSGSCQISIYTPATVSVAESPILNFAVIKSSTT